MPLIIPHLYDILSIDPPWEYPERNNINTKFGRGMNVYSSLSFEELKLLPINNLSNRNSILFLWSTWFHLDEAIELIEEWGFIYKTLGFLWLKTNKNKGDLRFGTGYYSKANTEPCLLAKKGRIEVFCNSISQIIVEPHQRDLQGKIIHSRKPPIARILMEIMFEGCYRYIRNKNCYCPLSLLRGIKKPLCNKLLENKYSPLNKLEIFATERKNKWNSIGYNIDGKDIRKITKKLILNNEIIYQEEK